MCLCVCRPSFLLAMVGQFNLCGPGPTMSLFSSKEPSKATPSIVVQKTGRNIDDMLQALIEGAADKDESVRSTIADSLGDIGRFEPELMLSMCASFLERNPKVRSSAARFSGSTGLGSFFTPLLHRTVPSDCRTIPLDA